MELNVLPPIGTVWAWQSPHGEWFRFTIKQYHDIAAADWPIGPYVETEEGEESRSLMPWSFGAGFLCQMIEDGRILPAHLAPNPGSC